MARIRVKGNQRSRYGYRVYSNRRRTSLILPILFFIVGTVVTTTLLKGRRRSMFYYSDTDTDTNTHSSYSESSSSTSVFNCEGKFGKCKYFYPFQFFSENDKNLEQKVNNGAITTTTSGGEGSEFLYIYEHIEELRQNGTLWEDMPRIVLLEMDMRHRNKKQDPKLNHNKVSFIHVHKAGGTSIHVQSRNWNHKPVEHMVYHYRYEHLNSHNFIPTYKHIKSSTKFKSPPDKWKEEEHVTFSFIRDPLDRFVSSIGQAMGASGSGKSKISKVLQYECVDNPNYSLENSRKILQCCIDFVAEYGYEIELHFTPQAIELAFATQMEAIPVALFQYETSYSDVLIEMGLDPELKFRDGDKNGMRPLPVLSEMTSADYTVAMKRQVCELYEVDVIMIRSLGWSVPSCDGLV